MKTTSPRKKFIEQAAHVAAYAWDAMELASTHDPDHERRLEILERQMERIGAPQYRLVKKGRR